MPARQTVEGPLQIGSFRTHPGPCQTIAAPLLYAVTPSVKPLPHGDQVAATLYR